MTSRTWVISAFGLIVLNVAADRGLAQASPAAAQTATAQTQAPRRSAR